MPSSVPAVLAFDDYVLDLAGRRLLRAGEPLPLEPKAFAVLSLLASAPGQVFARDEIVDAVWGHRHVTPGVLNRIMTLLRHAFGEDAQSPHYLHTVHGYGYRFDLPPTATAPSGVAPPGETGELPTASSAPSRRRSDRTRIPGTNRRYGPRLGLRRPTHREHRRRSPAPARHRD
ncbi:transcriptional regulator [Lysobacter cavernae]|uniref:Transcriptional regulator n=1 Tax=Lysobacter cavernae TaxID=1685901 RepID=A0ABV7RWF8_9GAMM